MAAKLKSHRPPGYSESKTKALCKIAKDLFQVLKTTQASLAYETLVLSQSKLKELSIVMVEFAEDLLNGLGIWEGLWRDTTNAFSARHFHFPYRWMAQ